MSDSKISVAQLTEDKLTVSARVNSHVIEMYKRSGIPLSLVIENSLVSFLRLSEDDKIKFLSQNMPDEVTADELKPLSRNWKELLTDYLTKMKVPSSIAPKLLSGLCAGAVGLIGGIFIILAEEALGKDQRKEERKNGSVE
jgi:hypothetical protein